MKRIFNYLFAVLWLSAEGQAFRYAVFEHFTQASCGPCAAQNPGFQASIIDPNPHTVRHIAYHTSWPGVDPMYSENPAASNTRVNYYGITGVPTVVLQGNYKKGLPGIMTMDDVTHITSQSSPVKITVTDVDNGTTHDVTVRIKSVGTPPTGSFRLLNVIIERNIWYTTPPGTNGETYFPNVMRYILPTNSGTLITLPAQGSEAVYTYSYTEDPDWNMAEIGVVSFLQHATTKEILNAGSTFDEVQNALLAAPSDRAVDAPAGQTIAFPFSVGNGGDASEQFVLTVISDAPSDWSMSLLADGLPLSTPATLSLQAGEWKNLSLEVVPSATPAFANYEITVSSVDNPLAPSLKTTVHVVSGITDLIVNNAGTNGVTPGNASLWEADYINGLVYSNNTSFDAVLHPHVVTAWKHGSMQQVKHLYFNVGWTFPGLPEDMVTMLAEFLNAGGNVLISGQDVAWETFDNANSPYASANKQNFLKTYFKVNFSSDGNTSNNPLTANMNDLYTSVPSAPINAYYGSSYFYPDQLKLMTGGIPIFYYNNLTTKIAGIRAASGTYKTVFLGVGLEMIGTTNDRNNIIKTTHDWFHGLIGDEDWTHAFSAFQAFPQPAASVLRLQLPQSSGRLEAFDVFGRLIHHEELSTPTTLREWDISSWASGQYVVRFRNNDFQQSLLISVVR